MKLHVFRSVSALCLTVLLAACGAGMPDQPTQTAAAVQSSSAAQVATAAMPAPDCAADGCKSPRVIDANAEAYRYDAMRRAAADDTAGTTQS